MKINIPLYSNLKDDTHCFQACMKMALKHFFPEKNFSFRKLEKMTRKERGKGTWPMAGAVALEKMGLRVAVFSMLDFRKFSKNALEYLGKEYGRGSGAIITENGSLDEAMKDSAEMVRRGIYRFRKLGTADIEKFFARGCMVILNVSHRHISDHEEEFGHYVIMTGFDRERIYVHDPGLPPRKDLGIRKSRFVKAWKHRKGEHETIVVWNRTKKQKAAGF